MKDSRHKIMFFLAVIAGWTLFSTMGAAGETKGGLSAQDEDAFVLYRYSLIDAGGNRSSKITESTEGNQTTYNYDGHALSCRTVMTGSITKTILESRTHVVGAFDVSNNSYGITQLSFDFDERRDVGRRTRTGTMTVNDKVIDIKQFDLQ